MNSPHSVLKRLLLAGGLALGVLATAALGGPSAGADPAKPTPSRTPTPPPATATPTAGAQAPPGSLGIPSICPPSGCIAPPISAIQVQERGTLATLSFTTLEPAAVTVDYKPATGPAAGGQSPTQGYATTHERKLTGLTSNTTYDVTVTATTQSGKKHTTKTSFTTFKKRVRIILQSIDIKDDGHWWGDAEPTWSLHLSWNDARPSAYCLYPQPCRPRKFEEGPVATPRNSEGKALMVVFAEENFDRFPESISLRGTAWDHNGRNPEWDRFWDCVQGVVDGLCTIGEDSPLMWRVPQGVEGAYQILTVRGDDVARGFESVLTFSVELLHTNAPEPAARNNPRTTLR
jgi:hypothetical protein